MLLSGALARAEEVADASIAWREDLPTAFAEAKEAGRVLMICINAKHVRGRRTEEPAAKGLREVVYKDPRVVAKSADFVCAFLTPEGTAEDYGELRLLGISGDLVSPQHVFVHPTGEKILLRREYWPHGQGEKGVEALLDVMEKAQRATQDAGSDPLDASDDGFAPPAEGEGRRAWVDRMVHLVVEGRAAEHEAALRSLIHNDVGGDCVDRLIALFEEHRKSAALIVAIVRALGRDGLESAAPGVAALLKRKEPAIRGNAAVSLEYIGCRDKGVVAALKRAAGKEKDEEIANHLYRALGRCGREDAKTRALLLKRAESARSEFATYGATIGLAYFEGDAKAARGVEKMLKKIGVPGSKRGGGQNTVKRGLVSWTLAAIGDRKSGDFVREELIGGLEHVKAFWVNGLRAFWNAVARQCDGDEDLMAGIEQGVKGFVSYAKEHELARYGAETRGLMDDFRLDRDTTTFQPKGDGLLGA